MTADNHPAPNPNGALILLTGATGYIGGRLLPRLLESGYRVRCMVRTPEHLHDRIPEGVEVVKGDVLDPDTLNGVMDGVTAAYYLIHSMGTSSGFEDKDRTGALNFSKAAKEAGVQRIIYLGGLGCDQQEKLSPHLASRQEVGRLLRESGIPTIEFRASIIIGSGSLSFEMIRALVKRLPIMTTPRWVRSKSQPISVEDILAYCLEALEIELPQSKIYEIGGPDQVSYCDIMREFARQRGLKRLIIPVPFLSPGLSSLWLGLVTPLYARIGKKIIDSVKHDTIVKDNAALQDFKVTPRGMPEAIERALQNEDQMFSETRWSDAVSSGGELKNWAGVTLGKRLIDSRTRTVNAPPDIAFNPIQTIGGKRGWYFGTWLWRIRGMLDLLVGGVGMRRGRKHPTEIHVGDNLDFWRVEAFEPDTLLRLRAEMRVPGRAWLQFEVKDLNNGQSQITQTALFDPHGLWGTVYWYLLWPLHQLVFSGMLRKIAKAAEKENP